MTSTIVTGVDRLSINALLSDAGEAMKAGIPLIAIFPVIDINLKSPRGEEALNPKILFVGRPLLLRLLTSA